MKARHRPRFDVDALRERAGAKVFARGEAYHRDGEVEILSIKPGRVLAQVAGTEDYRTELRGNGKDIDGDCSCPAFEDWGFCKHMVATALAANDLPAEGDGSGALDRIRDHLKQKGVDALIEMIMEVVELDPDLFRKLDTAAAIMHEDDKIVGARLRKMIDSATRTSSFIDYHEAGGWAADVDTVLDSIAGLASGARASLALELAGHAIDRIAEAIENIDDSDGHCSTLLSRASDIHLAAIREIRPEPLGLARDLFSREMADEYGTFEGAVTRYADMLGEAGLAEYRRLATEAWEKIPPHSVGRKRQEEEEEEEEEEFAGDQHRLLRILDFFAERAGEVDTRIALRARDLSSQLSYLQLAQFCLSHGREEEALRRAEEGLWMFEDQRPVVQFVLFAAELLSRAGRKQDAQKHLQRAFEKWPTRELCARLCESGGKAARERIVKSLEAMLAGGKRIGWNSPADLLIRIWMQEKMFDAAWAVVRKHGASVALKDELAGESEATHPAEALDVYATRVDRLAESGGDPAYAEAAKLVARMAKLRPRGEQIAYVLSLKVRFGRRRNFMKLLE
jgi:tetratricopeptide (TPR) repeat protein